MFTRLTLALCLAWTALAVSARADVVVELYTSQGCSACPPADEMLHELAEREGVIALALHVDYWDYIGWKDEFAAPAHAERQRAYAHSAGRRSIFTPQMIIGGQTSVVGARGMQVADAIMKHQERGDAVALRLTRSGSTLRIDAAPGGTGPLTVQMVRYTPERTAKITRGENAGHTLRYANVTEDWQVLGTWPGTAPLSMEVAAPGDKPVVVLLQRGTDGPIVAAKQVK